MVKHLLLLFFLALFFPRVIRAQVVINEFLVDPNPEWVELYNASDSAEYLKAYWLDDDYDFVNDSGSSSKKSLLNLNTTSINYPYIEFNSFLNNPSDVVVLFDQNGVKVDSYSYSTNPGSGISIGRYPDKSGELVALESATKGSPNSGPKSTPAPTSGPTSTPTPTPPPTNILTKTPTPKPTKKSATKTPTPTEFSEDDDTEVLSLRNDLTVTPTPNSEEVKSKKFPLGAFFLILGGLSFMGASAYPLLKDKVKIKELLDGFKRNKETF
jgi:hypothetical protein